MNKNTTMSNIMNVIRIRSTKTSTLTSTKMNKKHKHGNEHDNEYDSDFELLKAVKEKSSHR